MIKVIISIFILASICSCASNKVFYKNCEKIKNGWECEE